MTDNVYQVMCNNAVNMRGNRLYTLPEGLVIHGGGKQNVDTFIIKTLLKVSPGLN